MNGKGSRPRPYSVPAERFASNWDRVFRNATGDSARERPAPADSQSEKGEKSGSR